MRKSDPLKNGQKSQNFGQKPMSTSQKVEQQLNYKQTPELEQSGHPYNCIDKIYFEVIFNTFLKLVELPFN